MGLKPDHWIKRMAYEHDMIRPFIDRQVKSRTVENAIEGDITVHVDESVISYGLSSYGYDIRVADEFQVFHNLNGGVVDPKNFKPELMQARRGVDFIEIPPNSFALARTVEHFNIPRGVLTICLGKSTYARVGLIVNVTPFEPEWRGYATLEISNTTPLPARVYANEGIAQVLFFEADEACEVSYADKKGKYQDQQGVVTARV